MKNSILASLLLALTLVTSSAVAGPKSVCCDATKCKTACCKIRCCDAPYCPPAKGKAVKKATQRDKVAHVKSKSCCAMPMCSGACCKDATCCK